MIDQIITAHGFFKNTPDADSKQEYQLMRHVLSRRLFSVLQQLFAQTTCLFRVTCAAPVATVQLPSICGGEHLFTVLFNCCVYKEAAFTTPTPGFLWQSEQRTSHEIQLQSTPVVLERVLTC